VSEPADRAAGPQRIVCVRCEAAFGCDPAGDCWCRHEDVRLPMPAAGERCLCPDCLRAAAEPR